MDKQATFEATAASDRVNDLLADPDADVAEDSLLHEVESLAELDVDDHGDQLTYTVPTPPDDDRHLHVRVSFDDTGAVETVTVDVGTVVAPLVGHGYRWHLTAEGDITDKRLWMR